MTATTSHDQCISTVMPAMSKRRKQPLFCGFMNAPGKRVSFQHIRADLQHRVRLEHQHVDAAGPRLADAEGDVPAGSHALRGLERPAVEGQLLPALVGEGGVIRVADRDGAVVPRGGVTRSVAYQMV